MFAPNPKKEFTIAYDLDSIKKAIHNIINKEPAKYSLVNDDPVLNQIRFHEKITAWDTGYHIDFLFRKISDNETNVIVEVSRKMGAISNDSEVHNSNYIIKEVTDKFSSYLSGKVNAETGKAEIPKNEGCFAILVFLIIAVAYLLIPN